MSEAKLCLSEDTTPLAALNSQRQKWHTNGIGNDIIRPRTVAGYETRWAKTCDQDELREKQ